MLYYTEILPQCFLHTFIIKFFVNATHPTIEIIKLIKPIYNFKAKNQ